MHIIHAHIKVKPEFRTEYLDKVKELIKSSQEEEGNISYRLYEDTIHQNTFIMLEEWKDRAAIDFHFNTPHFKEWGQKSKEFVQEPTKVKIYEVISQE